MYIDETVYSGKPGDERDPVESDSYALLDKLGIRYARVDHEEAATIEVCLDVERVLGVAVCKNLLLCNRQQTDFYLLLMPGDKPFKTKDISQQLNVSRLSFASGEAMKEMLRINPGSLSILGLAFDTQNRVRLLIDRELCGDEYIGCHPCKNTSTLKISWKDINEKFLDYVKHEPTFVELPRYE